MICAPAGGGAVGTIVAACASTCGKQGLTFNKAGLSAPSASLERVGPHGGFENEWGRENPINYLNIFSSVCQK